MKESSDIVGVYRHSKKGAEYRVIGEGRHTETGERLVVYTEIDGDKLIWMRPYDMFFEKVIVEGREVDRFERKDAIEL